MITVISFISGLALGLLTGILLGVWVSKDPSNTYQPNPPLSPRDDLDEFLDYELGRKRHNTGTMWGDD